MPLLHLILQAGDNMILKRMKRRHSREQVLDFCKQTLSLRPNIAFGADIIAGFPTETDEMFNNTYELLNDIQKIVHLHVFPYSERSGTPAAKMPQVEKHIRKKRAASLRDLGKKLLNQHMHQQIGKNINIVVENNRLGRAEDFCMVNFINTNNTTIGTIQKHIVKSVNNGKLIVE